MPGTTGKYFPDAIRFFLERHCEDDVESIDPPLNSPMECRDVMAFMKIQSIVDDHRIAKGFGTSVFPLMITLFVS